jgi:hypothetical protein
LKRDCGSYQIKVLGKTKLVFPLNIEGKMRRISYKIFVALSLVLAVGLVSVSAKEGVTKLPKNKAGLSVKADKPYVVMVDGVEVGTAGVGTENVFVIEPGTHNVQILNPDPKGKSFSRDYTFKKGLRECICLKTNENITNRACPYFISVDAPDRVLKGDLVTFAAFNSVSASNYSTGSGSGTATNAGSNTNQTGTFNNSGQGTASNNDNNSNSNPTFVAPVLNYVWRVTPETARITSGLGTPSITVDTSGVPAGQTVRAELDVTDGVWDKTCGQMVASNVSIYELERPRSFKVEEFISRTFDDDKARLDAFAQALQNSPDAAGYIIVYQGNNKSDLRKANSSKLAARSLTYLVQNRGVSPTRVQTTEGGMRERTTYEFWIIPPGADIPIATPR